MYLHKDLRQTNKTYQSKLPYCKLASIQPWNENQLPTSKILLTHSTFTHLNRVSFSLSRFSWKIVEGYIIGAIRREPDAGTLSINAIAIVARTGFMSL